MPPVNTLPLVTSPDALIIPAISKPMVLKVKTVVGPLTLPTILPPAIGIFIVVEPLVNCDAAPTLAIAITLVNPAPLPVNNPPVILPVALTCPPVNIFPPVILPVAVTSPAVLMLPPTTLPVTVAATMLPFRLNCPVVNKLVTTALLAELLPDAVTVTAVTSARLRIVPVLEMVPVTIRLLRVESPVTFNVRVEYTPVLVTTKTLATLPDEMFTLPFANGILRLLVPLAIPVIPAVEKS